MTKRTNWKQWHYHAVHTWLSRNFKKEYCELCSTRIGLEWANLSGNSHRDRNDFVVLCKQCHYDFDWWNKYGYISDRRVATK